MTILAVTFSGGNDKAIGSLVATTDNRVFTLTSDHADFDDILTLLKAGRNAEAELRLDRATHVRAAVKNTAFTITDNVVSYDGRQLPAVMAQYIIRLNTEGFDLAPLEKFTANLFANPSYRATQECFKFIEANEMPITEDGCFIAYRSVTLDFKDHRTGKWDNSIGAVCKEDRNLVDEDPNNTCSKGLHVCALGYIHGPNSHGYGGSQSHWVIVKVNPKNVVAVPHDYKNTKMRVCEFEVVGQLDKTKIAPTATKSYVENKVIYTPTPPAAPKAPAADSDQTLIKAGKFYELGQKHAKNNAARGSGDPLTSLSFNTNTSHELYMAGYEGRQRPTAVATVPAPVPGTQAGEARALFNAGRYADLIEFKRQRRVSLNRLGFTAAEEAKVIANPVNAAAPAPAPAAVTYSDALGYSVREALRFDAHGYDQFGFRRSGRNRKGQTRGDIGHSLVASAPVAAPVAAAIATPPAVTASVKYNEGYADGARATSFKPLQIGNGYWSGYTAAWNINPNKK